MSDDLIIRVDKLGKSYMINHQAGRSRQTSSYRRLSEDLVSMAASPWHKARHLFMRQRIGAQPSREEFWALKDVSFDINRGEAVGIIGRNGAGKSTLLKILSRITEPTTGRVELDGRVASLLEVGTGFHPELTGRENIYLNGSILGMTRKEIVRKFDEIVDFAEVEKFLDTPVKRYSSGMYVRLAFAVAAHLEPEILVVDEVLAVGDLTFQKKCIGKMGDIAGEGRTILFVSHNMGAIHKLCTKGILLEKGRVSTVGTAGEVIEAYLSVHAGSGEVDLSSIVDRTGNGLARFVKAVTRNTTGEVCDTFTIGDDLVFDISIFSGRYIRNALMSLAIASTDGTPVYHLVAKDANFELNDVNGTVLIQVGLKNQKIYPGEYFVSLWLAENTSEDCDLINNAFKFHVVEGGTVITRILDRNSAIVHEIPEWRRLA